MPLAVQVLVLVLAVYGLNVAPAFAPPTWSLLVYFRLVFGLPVPVLVILGAAFAALGRLTLAAGFRRVAGHLPAKRRARAVALGARLSGRAGLVSLLLFFLVSPVPSNALFEAAGLAHLRLRSLTAAFLVGRLVSYTLYLVAASAARQSLQAIVEQGFVSWPALAAGLVSLAGVVSVVLVDWIRVIDWMQLKASGLRRKIP